MSLRSPPQRQACGNFAPRQYGGTRLQHSLVCRFTTDARETASQFVKTQKAKRLSFLEEEAIECLKLAANEFKHPAFPCALIAGDVVLLHLLHRQGLLSDGKVPVVFVDTFHLFPESHKFLQQCEDLYSFKAHVYKPAGFTSKAEYQKAHGSDLFITDIEKYDLICKVEPFQRALSELQVDVMINGRRRDHGAERAQLEVFEASKSPVNCNPLAYWTFQDCWDYLSQHQVPYHPLHDQGYPSIGDVHSTVPVPKDRWFLYGGERSGRFQGLTNADGSTKTECGIHLPAATAAASSLLRPK